MCTPLSATAAACEGRAACTAGSDVTSLLQVDGKLTHRVPREGGEEQALLKKIDNEIKEAIANQQSTQREAGPELDLLKKIDKEVNEGITQPLNKLKAAAEAAAKVKAKEAEFEKAQKAAQAEAAAKVKAKEAEFEKAQKAAQAEAAKLAKELAEDPNKNIKEVNAKDEEAVKKSHEKSEGLQESAKCMEVGVCEHKLEMVMRSARRLDYDFVHSELMHAVEHADLPHDEMDYMREALKSIDLDDDEEVGILWCQAMNEVCGACASCNDLLEPE
jgi:hypothetical protein